MGCGQCVLIAFAPATIPKFPAARTRQARTRQHRDQHKKTAPLLGSRLKLFWTIKGVRQ